MRKEYWWNLKKQQIYVTIVDKCRDFWAARSIEQGFVNAETPERGGASPPLGVGAKVPLE